MDTGWIDLCNQSTSIQNYGLQSLLARAVLTKFLRTVFTEKRKPFKQDYEGGKVNLRTPCFTPLRQRCIGMCGKVCCIAIRKFKSDSTFLFHRKKRLEQIKDCNRRKIVAL